MAVARTAATGTRRRRRLAPSGGAVLPRRDNHGATQSAAKNGLFGDSGAGRAPPAAGGVADRTYPWALALLLFLTPGDPPKMHFSKIPQFKLLMAER